MILHRLFLLFSLFLSVAQAQEFLDPASAFKPSARAIDGQTIEVRFDIAKGYYLYRDKFRLSIEGEGASAGTPVFPDGKKKHDDNFGEVEVYYGSVTIRLPVERNASGSLPVTLKVSSQGCADAGICYPPQSQKLSVELPDPAAPPLESRINAGDGDESGKIAAALKGASFWTNLAFFFAAGLGLALTPCVYPMIPILSGIIVGQGHKASHARGFALALTYVLGMALTYTAAGIAAGLAGTLVSTALQNAWVLGSFALVFVALALSMFGFYELQLPVALQSKLSEDSGHLQGGRGLGVFVMGALSALIVGPCITAPLFGALIYIGQTGDALFGGTALFVMALGMGAPLIVVGTAGGSLLPKAGPWMEGIKKGFGVILLATAVWLVSPVIPAVVQMLAWSVLLIIPAIYLHALDPLPPHAKGWQRFWKGVGIVMLLAGAAQLAGVLAGSRDPLQPLTGLRATTAAGETPRQPFQPVRSQAGALPGSRDPLQPPGDLRAPAATGEMPGPAFQPIHSVAELDARLATTDRPVMLDFYADWCVSCKEMDKLTLSDGQVREKLSGFTLLRADVTANSENDKALLNRFGLFGPPGIIFFDRSGKEVHQVRVVGFQEPARFLASLRLLE